MPGSRVALEEYKYQTLGETQIRILHLQPGEGDDTVFVEISIEELATVLDYEALSWEWGCNAEIEGIRIKDKNSSETQMMMKIKPNLLAALRHLRHGHKIRRLWVDAICINQIEQGNEKDDNTEEEKSSETDKNREKNREKSNQISVMTKIYGNASNVCVWLGDESEDSTKAIELIERIVQLEDVDSLVQLENDNSMDWEALIKLLKRGWFSRRWVVQVLMSLWYPQVWHYI